MGPKCARIPNYDGQHYVGTWLDSSLPDLYNTTQHASGQTGRLSAPPPPHVKCNPQNHERCPGGTVCPKSGVCPDNAAGCVGAKCMWFNESAPHVKSDMFVVQAMPGVSRDTLTRCFSPLPHGGEESSFSLSILGVIRYGMFIVLTRQEGWGWDRSLTSSRALLMGTTFSRSTNARSTTIIA